MAYAGTDIVDADTDGDGVRDGADDQDHDDIPNIAEMQPQRGVAVIFDRRRGLRAAQGAGSTRLSTRRYGRVNPFNPCLPATFSRTCPRHSGVGGGRPRSTARRTSTSCTSHYRRPSSRPGPAHERALVVKERGAGR